MNKSFPSHLGKPTHQGKVRNREAACRINSELTLRTVSEKSDSMNAKGNSNNETMMPQSDDLPTSLPQENHNFGDRDQLDVSGLQREIDNNVLIAHLKSPSKGHLWADNRDKRASINYPNSEQAGVKSSGIQSGQQSHLNSGMKNEGNILLDMRALNHEDHFEHQDFVLHNYIANQHSFENDSLTLDGNNGQPLVGDHDPK